MMKRLKNNFLKVSKIEVYKSGKISPVRKVDVLYEDTPSCPDLKV